MSARIRFVGALMVGAMLTGGPVITPRYAWPTACPKALTGEQIEESDYRYPYRDPYLATMTIAMLNPEGVTPGLKRQVVHVKVLPGRDRFPSLEGRGQLSVALYRQSGPAPLLFILSGIGSNPYF